MIERNGKNLLPGKPNAGIIKAGKWEIRLQLIQADVISFIKYLSESFHALASEKEINLTLYSEVDEF